MALTYSPTPTLGAPCPDFQLSGVDGKPYSLDSFSSAKALVVMFICNHCPYVKAVEDRLLELARRTAPQGAQFVAVCSNDPTDHPDDLPANLLKRWKEKSYPFPYLVDQAQDVAKSFGAVCTPDFFVFDKKRKLTYRGRLDDSWKDPHKVQRQELADAIHRAINDQAPVTPQTSSMGCSIKWRTANKS